MFGGFEIKITDEEATKIFTINQKDSSSFIRLETGEMIRLSGIQAIIDPPLIAYWGGYLLNKDKRGYNFMRDGQRCYLEQHNLAEITYKPDPDYISNKNLLE